jgi:hypothetical protein
MPRDLPELCWKAACTCRAKLPPLNVYVEIQLCPSAELLVLRLKTEIGETDYPKNQMKFRNMDRA